MNKKFIENIKTIDHLIRLQDTGNAIELAKKIGISRANTYQYLNIMKELGAPIKYDQPKKTYYYDCEGIFIAKFFRKP